jgi:outer membrane immunogenic protein
MDLHGTGIIPSSDPAQHQDLTLDSGLYATATGRLGWAFGDTLIYGKGGWAHFDSDAKQTTTKPGFISTGTGAFNGTVYGGGVEHFINRNITIKAEYLHFNFGTRGGMQTSITDDPPGFHYLNETSVVDDTVKVGVAVHF